MLSPTCLCGQIMTFKPGETKTFCKTPGCGVVQECGPEGYWAYGRSRLVFTPNLTAEVKRKLNHYQKYMRWRNRARKAVRPC